jgi:hypothetical protein
VWGRRRVPRPPAKMKACRKGTPILWCRYPGSMSWSGRAKKVNRLGLACAWLCDYGLWVAIAALRVLPVPYCGWQDIRRYPWLTHGYLHALRVLFPNVDAIYEPIPNLGRIAVPGRKVPGTGRRL